MPDFGGVETTQGDGFNEDKHFRIISLHMLLLLRNASQCIENMCGDTARSTCTIESKLTYDFYHVYVYDDLVALDHVQVVHSDEP